jgi:hypothetical protein
MVRFEVLVMGEKRKRVPVRRGLPRAGSLVERKALVGAEEHQHQKGGRGASSDAELGGDV